MPADGQTITFDADMSLNVPDPPIIAFIEGDGIGRDITPVMIRVVDAAVAKAYGASKKIPLDGAVRGRGLNRNRIYPSANF